MAVIGCQQQQVPIAISHAVAIDADHTFAGNEVDHLKKTAYAF
jgi:hypothetical protein